jgi:D-glycero-D-manno-heptose 1,7-bisphosphate phosphatase
LDRDGVINIDDGYVYKIDEFKFISGIFDFALKFRKAGYKIFVITNQSGIARGYYTVEDFRKVTSFMEKEFLKRGVTISKTYFCPCLPPEECLCRKPNPYMLLQARDEFQIDLENSIFVGDKSSDIEAGNRAGVKSFLFKNSSDFEFILDNSLL